MAQTIITTSRPPKRSAVKALGNYSFILIFLCIFLVYLWRNANALTLNGVMNILRHSTVVGIIAFGMGLSIITGGIDLSVGSMLALIGGLSVEVFNNTNNPLVTLLFALGLGLILGLINGALIGYVRMPAFIVTLATMMIYRSMAQYYLRAALRKSIFQMNGQLTAYQPFYDFGQSKALGFIPTVGIIFILVTAVMVFIATSTKYGKSVYAIGSNERAAQLAGVNVGLTRATVYVITGVLCGAAAYIWLAMNGSVDPATLGKSNEMYAIAAVVIGGISMSGGKGKLLGVMFGAMSYTCIDKIIAAMRMDALINDTIKGTILLVAVLIQILIPMLRGRMGKQRA
ncbi:MAG: ABC transporter permease [Oscillospiraceae bacterium]|jgi:ribose transport system permease protein|nr:ABC transporter permease [Oscillospiraceae bacterium]